MTNIEGQIEENENGSDDCAEPNDVMAAIEPEVLAVFIKFAWLWSIGKQHELPLAPVEARHVNEGLTSAIALGPMSLLDHNFRVSRGELQEICDQR